MNERAIFEAALEIPDPDRRRARLDQLCGGDAVLRTRIEALLESHQSPSQFLNVPAVAQFKSTVSQAGQHTAMQPKPGNAGHGLRDDDSDGKLKAGPDFSFLSRSSKPDAIGALGHYEILHVLGQGAFGIVFKAFDEKLHRHVAIKVLDPQMAATSPPRKRFLREARSAAAIRHENIVQVYCVEEQPLPYLVMEYIDGQTLQQKLDGAGPLELPELLNIGRQLAAGLAAAHEQGLIHRDIKPGNILLEKGVEQRVKVTDFGLARAADDASLTRTGLISGTPMYMSPEQVNGAALDHRTDLFSLGSVLYVMASGRPPFRADKPIAVLKRVTDETPRPIQEIIPEIPDWLCAIIAKLHCKKPEDRFQSAQEVADLLTRYQAELRQYGCVELLGELSPKAPEITKVNQPEPQSRQLAPDMALAAVDNPLSRRHRWLAWAAIILVLIVGLGLTEATGFTHVQGTVIRLFSPAGTLVVEVNDPAVSVSIDGEELVITGTGLKEIRLQPGQHKLLASRDGKLVHQELVTVTGYGRQMVRIAQEAAPTANITEHLDLSASEEPGFVPLFNGRDLTGWETKGNANAHWRVRDGVLLGSWRHSDVDMGSVIYTQRNDYQNFRFRVQTTLCENWSASMRFLWPNANERGGFIRAVIGSTSGPDAGDTAILRRSTKAPPLAIPRVPVQLRKNEWFTQEVVVQGRKIQVLVNNVLRTEYELPEQPLPGHLGIELSGAAMIRIRKIEVQELPPSVTAL